MSQNGNRALEGNQDAETCSVDVHRRSNPTKSCQLSPTRRQSCQLSPTEMPKTALAAAYEEALARREGRP
jgi:hypothetical protein